MLVALAVIGVLIFTHPEPMIAPGPVIPAHGQIATDCFACHAPLRGATAERCIACHAVAKIGLVTSKGQPILHHPGFSSAAKPARVGFHQALAEPDCMACHTDHANPALTRRPQSGFTHALLRADVRGTCSSCHTAPDNSLHRSQKAECSACHRTSGWKPASFDHSRYFPLTGDHRLPCSSCHLTPNFKSYSCTSCHEHNPARMQAVHAEEGIRNLANCVRCHRNGTAEEGEGGEGRDRGEGEDD